ncbi:N-acetyltransferase family protein [Sphingobacterium hungaricum]
MEDLKIRLATLNDSITAFEFSNDPITRLNSFNTKPIEYEDHKKWWVSKLNDTDSIIYICEVENIPVGMVRFEKKDQNVYIIGITISENFRGKGLAEKFIRLSCDEVVSERNCLIEAYIKFENKASIRIFEKSNFRFIEFLEISETRAVKYQLN